MRAVRYRRAAAQQVQMGPTGSSRAAVMSRRVDAAPLVVRPGGWRERLTAVAGRAQAPAVAGLLVKRQEIQR